VVDDAFTFTGRAAYDVTDNINAYFSYSTGYKPPASNLALTTLPPTTASDGSVVGRFAGGEDVRVFEFGVKAAYEWGFINLALFDQSVDDFQSVIFTGIGQQLSNAGEQTVQGVEVEASVSPIDPLNLFFGLTYLDPEFKSFEAAPCPSAGFLSITDPAIVAACADPAVNSVDISGTRPAGIHDVSLTTSASYRFDLGNGTTLTPRIEYLYENEISLFEPENGSAPTRAVSQINANILLLMENGFAVNLWGRNLTDDDSNITFFNSVAQAGSFNSYITPPRQWGVSIRKEF
jgi:iron complex outermembrane receptor protein